MSHVQNVIVWTMCDDETEAITAIQKWLADHNHGQMVELSEMAGGRKGVEAYWWGISTNYLEITEFLTTVFAQNWEFPSHVCVILEDQHDDIPTIYRSADEYQGIV